MGNSKSIHSPEPLEVPGIGRYGDLSLRKSLRGSKKMDRLRRSFRDSFRRRKDRVPESLKPYQWQADETAVRNGTCTFQVKYLGCVEVFESRGMLVCEEALRVLRNVRKRPIRAVLHVSGDGLRVVEEDTKGLLVDQTIEKVSFCAPDKLVEKGFSYICRDGTTRRWMCHGFLTVRETGERLSHAVGCAFAVCLERKQIRDRECTVSYAFDNKSATFTRSGSFRKASLIEQQEQRASIGGEERENERPARLTHRQQMHQSRKNPFAIERPHATPLMLERQSSFRGFSQLSQSSSPFKRQMSLRITDLPSNSERQKIFLASQQQQKSHNQKQQQLKQQQQQQHNQQQQQQQHKQQQQSDNNNESSVTALCQQLTKGLNLLSNSNQSLNDNDFNSKGIQDLFDPLNITTTGSININFNNSISNNFCHISQTNNQTSRSHNYGNPNNSNSRNRNNDFENVGAIRNEPINCLTNSRNESEQLLPESVLGTQISANNSSSQLPNPDQWLGNISTAFATSPSLQLGDHHNHLIDKLTKNSISSRAMSFDENFSPSLPASPLPSPNAKTSNFKNDSLSSTLSLAEITSGANISVVTTVTTTAAATTTATTTTTTNTSRLPLTAVSSPANNTIKDPFDVQWADTVVTTSDIVPRKSHLNDELSSSLSLSSELPESSDVRFAAETINDNLITDCSNLIIPKNTTNPFLVNS